MGRTIRTPAEVGAVLRSARLAAGHRVVRHFASQFGMPSQTILNWENGLGGKAALLPFAQVADALNLSMDQICYEEDGQLPAPEATLSPREEYFRALALLQQLDRISRKAGCSNTLQIWSGMMEAALIAVREAVSKQATGKLDREARK